MWTGNIKTLLLLLCIVAPTALILVSRGFLLGRVWALRPWKFPPCGKPPKGEDEGAWGKRRWHLRVGFYALDSVLGLATAVTTATLFAVVAKVTTGRPRPNYYALRLFTENAANGQDYTEFSVEGWPSGHATSAMAGLLFLSFVLWRDLMALVQWRRREHPRLTLVLAVLGGFVVAALPMSAILIGISRIRDYMQNPDDVLAGLVLGSASAHWSFRFVVMMPFHHEIGSPQWRPDPKWVEQEEREWEAEEEEMMRLCPWLSASKGDDRRRRRRRRRRRVRIREGESASDVERPRTPPPLQAPRPTRVPDRDASSMIGKYDNSPA